MAERCGVPGGPLSSGGEIPCPFCNGKAAIAASRRNDHVTWAAARASVNRVRAKYGFGPVGQKEKRR